MHNVTEDTFNKCGLDSIFCKISLTHSTTMPTNGLVYYNAKNIYLCLPLKNCTCSAAIHQKTGSNNAFTLNTTCIKISLQIKCACVSKSSATKKQKPYHSKPTLCEFIYNSACYLLIWNNAEFRIIMHMRRLVQQKFCIHIIMRRYPNAKICIKIFTRTNNCRYLLAFFSSKDIRNYLQTYLQVNSILIFTSNSSLVFTSHNTIAYIIFRLTNMQIFAVICIYMLAANFYRDSPMLALLLVLPTLREANKFLFI